ncbi:hypothetical protein FOMPIDRAFT_93602 [Fomitopsis schrenkii]|uniref:GST N-terminal domain-containing protein n=1 Tax=Fomitopsis schrenkii TaxID=2126942 RepID=S8DS44_FOMSC|nr:hypothetical protein FOMPIDRAFT_93602 [Fomitopsis schrenkii]
MSHPDENVYPTGTGRALETVNQYEGTQDLVFRAGWKEKEILGINPKGLVPAVEYKGRAL